MYTLCSLTAEAVLRFAARRDLQMNPVRRAALEKIVSDVDARVRVVATAVMMVPRKSVLFLGLRVPLASTASSQAWDRCHR